MTQSRNADKFVCRLPDGMREQLANVAATNRRSMNSELVYRLETSLAGAAQDDQDVAATPAAQRRALALCVAVLQELTNYSERLPNDVEGSIASAIAAARPLLRRTELFKPEKD